MKFNIIAGSHSCTADFEIDAKGCLTGTFTIPAIGAGTATGTSHDGLIDGEIAFEGHTAYFKASIQGNEISGHLSVPFPADLIVKSTDFTGSQVP